MDRTYKVFAFFPYFAVFILNANFISITQCEQAKQNYGNMPPYPIVYTRHFRRRPSLYPNDLYMEEVMEVFKTQRKPPEQPSFSEEDIDLIIRCDFNPTLRECDFLKKPMEGPTRKRPSIPLSTTTQRSTFLPTTTTRRTTYFPFTPTPTRGSTSTTTTTTRVPPSTISSTTTTTTKPYPAATTSTSTTSSTTSTTTPSSVFTPFIPFTTTSTTTVKPSTAPNDYLPFLPKNPEYFTTTQRPSTTTKSNWNFLPNISEEDNKSLHPNYDYGTTPADDIDDENGEDLNFLNNEIDKDEYNDIDDDNGQDEYDNEDDQDEYEADENRK